MAKFIAFSLILVAAVSAALAAAPATRPAATTQPATRPATQPVDREAVAKLIRQLGDSDFAVRETATKQLVEMGEGVRPLLVEKAKEKDLDAEVAQRIEAVIAQLDGQHVTGVTGKVVDADGKPVAGATVVVMRPQLVGAMVAIGQATTGADGVFVFPLPPGGHRLALRASAGGPESAKGVFFTLKAGETHDAGELKLPRPPGENK